MRNIPSTLLLWLVAPTAGYLLPDLPGKHNVTLTTGPLIDFSRSDPYSAKPIPRALMLSVFEPATCDSTSPVLYMPNKTAEYQGPYLEKVFNISIDLSPLFLQARLPVCLDKHRGCPPSEDYPILLFSPGYGIPRFYYNVLASAIASGGFIVITIDHPEDANILVYPDGHAVYNNASIWDHLPEGVRTRAADASFIIDQLKNATAMAELLPHRRHRPFLTDRIGMLGHSLGGSTAIIAAGKDHRIRGAINWDGTIFGSLPSSGLSHPVLIVSEATNETDASWTAQWPRMVGPKLWVQVANTTHQTYSDVPTLLQAGGEGTTAFADLLGTIAPARLVQILADSTTAWMNEAFAAKEGKALEELTKFSEVSVVRKAHLQR